MAVQCCDCLWPTRECWGMCFVTQKGYFPRCMGARGGGSFPNPKRHHRTSRDVVRRGLTQTSPTGTGTKGTTSWKGRDRTGAWRVWGWTEGRVRSKVWEQNLLLPRALPLSLNPPMNRALGSEKSAFSLDLGRSKPSPSLLHLSSEEGITALQGRLGHLLQRRRGPMSYFPVWELWLESRFWARLFKHSPAFEELYE